jgi:hypothetical protein
MGCPIQDSTQALPSQGWQVLGIVNVVAAMGWEGDLLRVKCFVFACFIIRCPGDAWWSVQGW